LKGEFLDRLEKLPIWNRTKFYCFASELLDVFSGKSLNQNGSSDVLSTWGADRSRWKPLRDEAFEIFRLGKYKVTVASNSQITWQTLEARNRITGGQCTIQSGILFIGPKEHETVGRSAREFLGELSRIPPWSRTRIWSHGSALRPCESPPQTGQIKVLEHRDRRRDHGCGENAISDFWKGAEKTLKSLWSPGIKFRRPSPPRLRLPSHIRLPKPSWFLWARRKFRFTWLIPLLLASLLFGIILSLFSGKETSHRHHASEERHHR
jgi:hypothetical protein